MNLYKKGDKIIQTKLDVTTISLDDFYQGCGIKLDTDNLRQAIVRANSLLQLGSFMQTLCIAHVYRSSVLTQQSSPVY